MQSLKNAPASFQVLGPCSEDLEFVRGLFRGQNTKLGFELEFLYFSMNQLLEGCEKDEKAMEAIRGAFKEKIVEKLDRTIRDLCELALLERDRDSMESEAELDILPIDAVLERVHRYRCSNDRRFAGHLQLLETVRRLRGTYS